VTGDRSGPPSVEATEPDAATSDPQLSDATVGVEPFAWKPVLAAAGLGFAILMATAWRYGFHRDELYFLEASRHMAWGYVDQPPLSVGVMWLARHLFGTSLVGIRLFPALAVAGAVVLAALICRELRGSRFAQGMTALLVATSPFLIIGHLAGPTAYDLVGWLGLSVLVLRILRTGRERLWLAAGAVAGCSILAKETILFLVGALVIGLLVNRQWRVFRSGWLWVGAAIAVAIWSPNLVWEIQHHWPAAEMSRNLRAEHGGLGNTAKFVGIQLLLPGWWTLPVWVAGLLALLRETRFRWARSFGVAYLVLYVLIGITIGDRPYYLAPLYGVLFAAGSIVGSEVVAGVRRFWSTRRPGRRLVWRSTRRATVFVIAAGMLDLAVALPVLPAHWLHTVPLQKINYNLGEEIGWPEFTATVAGVWRSLPTDERAHAVILTANYGEAGAIDLYGSRLGLPPAYSGHNNWWWWGRPPDGTTTVITVGMYPIYLRHYFGRSSVVATIRNSAGVENDEEGQPVAIARRPLLPWPKLWPLLRHYD
jgi:4-amino-4-deoxy-L-arabinose transferase-like glycosyltransferase